MKKGIMEYNIQYIDVKYKLINTFLINMNNNILDISYNIHEKTLEIQIVLLEGSTLTLNSPEHLTALQKEYSVAIKEVYLNKEKFNENKGESAPIHYTWLQHLLFSKAAQL